MNAELGYKAGHGGKDGDDGGHRRVDVHTHVVAGNQVVRLKINCKRSRHMEVTLTFMIWEFENSSHVTS